MATSELSGGGPPESNGFPELKRSFPLLVQPTEGLSGHERPAISWGKRQVEFSSAGLECESTPRVESSHGPHYRWRFR